MGGRFWRLNESKYTTFVNLAVACMNLRTVIYIYIITKFMNSFNCNIKYNISMMMIHPH